MFPSTFIRSLTSFCSLASSTTSTSATTPSSASTLTPSEKQALLANEKRRRRRESHNAVERRRRDNINEKIGELATLIPDVMFGGAGAGGGGEGEGFQLSFFYAFIPVVVLIRSVCWCTFTDFSRSPTLPVLFPSYLPQRYRHITTTRQQL